MTPENPIVGGTVLRIPAIQSPNFSIVNQTGWAIFQNGTAYFFNVNVVGVITGGTLVIDGVNGGVFVYSGAPELGNIVASLVGSTVTDQFGNVAVGPGFTIYGPNGQNIFIGPADGIPVIQFTPASSTHLFTPPQIDASTINAGAANEQLAVSFSSGNETGNQGANATIVLISGSNDATQPAAVQLAANLVVLTLKGNTATLETAAGHTGQIPISQTDSSSTSQATSAAIPVSKVYTIEAGDGQVATLYRLKAYGNGAQAAAPGVIAVGIWFNGAQLAAASVAAAIVGASAGFKWSAEIIISVRTTGSGGTAEFAIHGDLTNAVAATSTNQASFATDSTSVTFNTTIANTIAVSAAMAANAGSISCYASSFERLGP